jgi:hypothetical protein
MLNFMRDSTNILHHQCTLVLKLLASFIHKSVYDFLFSVISTSYEQFFTANNLDLNL